MRIGTVGADHPFGVWDGDAVAKVYYPPALFPAVAEDADVVNGLGYSWDYRVRAVVWPHGIKIIKARPRRPREHC